MSTRTPPDETSAARVPEAPELAALIARICRDIAELPDRTSPEDWPDAMLVTADELGLIIRNALEDQNVRLITTERLAKLETTIDFAWECAAVPVSSTNERDNKGRLLMQLLKDARATKATKE